MMRPHSSFFNKENKGALCIWKSGRIMQGNGKSLSAQRPFVRQRAERYPQTGSNIAESWVENLCFNHALWSLSHTDGHRTAGTVLLLQPACGKNLYFIRHWCAALGSNINLSCPPHISLWTLPCEHSDSRSVIVRVLACKVPIGGHYLNRLIIKYFHQEHGVHIDALGAGTLNQYRIGVLSKPKYQPVCRKESDGRDQTGHILSVFSVLQNHSKNGRHYTKIWGTPPSGI